MKTKHYLGFILLFIVVLAACMNSCVEKKEIKIADTIMKVDTHRVDTSKTVIVKK